mmetsp:Transcript_15003/g.44165  ORF Transcript_15003/g.44165 Transcript_15003/m.44165 type:complete len:215 (+) Transcript_15003:586-1230(+)
MRRPSDLPRPRLAWLSARPPKTRRVPATRRSLRRPSALRHLVSDRAAPSAPYSFPRPSEPQPSPRTRHLPDRTLSGAPPSQRRRPRPPVRRPWRRRMAYTLCAPLRASRAGEGLASFRPPRWRVRGPSGTDRAAASSFRRSRGRSGAARLAAAGRQRSSAAPRRSTPPPRSRRRLGTPPDARPRRQLQGRRPVRRVTPLRGRRRPRPRLRRTRP